MNGTGVSAGHPGVDVIRIGGALRTGRSDGLVTDYNPWSGEVIAEIPGASITDATMICAAAQIVQCEWSQGLPRPSCSWRTTPALGVCVRHYRRSPSPGG